MTDTRTKAELLEILDGIEKQIGAVIVEATGNYVVDNGTEPLSIQQARIRYGEGGLWLRHWIGTDKGG